MGTIFALKNDTESNQDTELNQDTHCYLITGFQDYLIPKKPHNY